MLLLQRLVHRGVLAESDLPRVAELQAAAPNRPLHELLIDKGVKYLYEKGDWSKPGAFLKV